MIKIRNAAEIEFGEHRVDDLCDRCGRLMVDVGDLRTADEHRRTRVDRLGPAELDGEFLELDLELDEPATQSAQTPSMPADFPAHIFRAYDIRGNARTELTEELMSAGRDLQSIYRGLQQLLQASLVVAAQLIAGHPFDGHGEQPFDQGLAGGSDGLGLAGQSWVGVGR